MSYLEIYYDDSLADWQEVLDKQADKALEEIDYIPSVILCYPREEARQLKLFNQTDGAKTDGYNQSSLELSG